MSLYHLNRTVIKRSAGNSVCKGLSYIHRTKIRDEYFGKTYSFQSKEEEVVESKIYIPESAPTEIKNMFKTCDSGEIETFAQLLERAEDDIIEKRCTSEATRDRTKSRMQTGFMEVVGLQKELSLEQNREIMDQYIEKVYMPRGLLVSSAIHFEEENPHAHLFISLRAVDKDGFSPIKERELMTRSGLKSCREMWAEVTNNYFKKLGLENRITHKSFKALGVELNPTIHEGDARHTLFSEKVTDTNRTKNEYLRTKNREILQTDPERMIPLLMSKRVMYIESDVRREFIKLFPGDPDTAESLTSQVLEAESIVKVNQTRKSEPLYTAESYLRSEEALLDSARNLRQSNRHGLKEATVSRMLSKQFDHLSKEQKSAVRTVTQGEALDLVIGKAGTGKSTLMEAVARSYQAKGYRVFGGAWSGAAAEDLEQTVGVASHTLLSWFKRWQSFEERAYSPKHAGGFFRSGFFLEDYKQQLNHKTVFILDEAGTVDVEHMSKLLTKAHAVGAKVIAVGDYDQSSPIGPGDSFKALCDVYPPSKLEGIKRQKEAWMREASQKFSEHNVAAGLEAYAKNASVHWHDKNSVHSELIQEYLKEHQSSTKQLALAHSNEDVFQMNVSIHTKLKGSGRLGRKSLLVKTLTTLGSPTVEFTVRDRVLFLKNDNQGTLVQTVKGKRSGITNGTLGTLIYVSQDKLEAKLDDGRTVSLNPKAYPYLSHGYAMTISKAQGKTVEKSLVLVNSSMEAATTYVALTRHQRECQIYINQSKFENLESLVPQISKETSFDFINRPKAREQTIGKPIQRNGFYDRKEILSKISKNDIPQLMETYTPFRQNPRESRSQKLIFSESGQGTSVHVTLKKDEPLAHNFKDGFGADLVGFLAHYSNKSYGEICHELGKRLGVSRKEATVIEHSVVTQKQEQNLRAVIKDEIAKRQLEKQEDISKIQKQMRLMKVVPGTLAENYLRLRGINHFLPNDLKFQESNQYGPSLVAVARDYNGTITAIQRTRLDPQTQYKILGALAKISRGCVYGSSVLIQNDPEHTNIAFLTEGIETALSIREAGVKGEIRATLGKSNLLNVGLTLASDRKIIIVADNDGQYWQKDKGTMKVVQTLRKYGFQVDVLFPREVGAKDKCDFNDILQTEQGLQKIRNTLSELGPEFLAAPKSIDFSQSRGR